MKTKTENSIKEIIKKHHGLYVIANRILSIITLISGGVKIINHGNGRFKKDVYGKNNSVYIGYGTMIHNCTIQIRGNNNKIIIGCNCMLRNRISFWITGNNCSIILGNGITFQHSNHFNCQEDGCSIVVGDDCMFSNNIIVRTSDSHPIYDMNTGKRLNLAKDIRIGNHVWIAPNSRIMKGSDISDGCVVGSNTLVTKYIPSNVLVVGMPAKIVRQDIRWERRFIQDFL